jgi:hypothetical protein
MSDQGKPKLKVLIKSQFDEAHEPVGLDVVLSIESPDLADGSPIASFLSIVKPAIKRMGSNVRMRRESCLPLITPWITVPVLVGLLDAKPAEKPSSSTVSCHHLIRHYLAFVAIKEDC